MLTALSPVANEVIRWSMVTEFFLISKNKERRRVNPRHDITYHTQ